MRTVRWVSGARAAAGRVALSRCARISVAPDISLCVNDTCATCSHSHLASSAMMEDKLRRRAASGRLLITFVSDFKGPSFSDEKSFMATAILRSNRLKSHCMIAMHALAYLHPCRMLCM